MARSGLQYVTVMVVEDNANMRNVLRTVLQLIGVGSIVTASDGREALELLRTRAVDILMVDWEMKPMDGLEMIRAIRMVPDHPNRFTPVIMVSAHSEVDRVRQARDAGVNEFLVKPISAKRVMERLIDVIEKPRQYVKSRSYFGPDRRRRSSKSGYHGPFRRKDDKPAEAAAAIFAAEHGEPDDTVEL
jgi:CheY-like chemotaxis protein